MIMLTEKIDNAFHEINARLSLISPNFVTEFYSVQSHYKQFYNKIRYFIWKKEELSKKKISDRDSDEDRKLRNMNF